MAVIGSLAIILPCASLAIEVAITIDDPGMESVGPYTASEINRRILQTLKSHRIQAALFVCGKRVDSPSGQALLSDWDQASHWIGSHSYSHLNFHDETVSAKVYAQDIDQNLKLVQGFRNFQKIFRFPFLKEGNTEEKRDAVRKHLADQGYRNGYVTVDTSDWAISSRLK